MELHICRYRELCESLQLGLHSGRYLWASQVLLNRSGSSELRPTHLCTLKIRPNFKPDFLKRLPQTENAPFSSRFRPFNATHTKSRSPESFLNNDTERKKFIIRHVIQLTVRIRRAALCGCCCERVF